MQTFPCPASLGTLLLHSEVYPSLAGKQSWKLAALNVLYCCLPLLVQWVSQGRLRTGIEWADRRLQHFCMKIWSYFTWLRLTLEMSWVVRALSAGGSKSEKACTWIARRVSEERNKAADHQLDSYVRADNLKIAPSFDDNTVDTEDLDFICAAKTVKDAQKRPLSAALIAACVHSDSVSGIRKEDALEALAQLTYLKSLALVPGDQLFLATELVRMCRVTLEEDQSIDYVHSLEIGLTGLANLALSHPGIGSFLKGERLFSIIAGLVKPTVSLGHSCRRYAEEEALNFKPHFNSTDLGYQRSELSTARKKHRASSLSSNPASNSSRDAPCPAIHVRAYYVPWSASQRLRLACASFRLTGRLSDLFHPGKAQWKVVEQFTEGVWYRLLTAALRLISALSSEAANHAWLLEQGALQAVRKILQYLPADRMRSGHLEAALCVYRLFENPAVHAAISKSSALKAAAHGILIELRAIDSDLFGKGWGTRIGSQLYEELCSVEQEPPAKSAGTEEQKNGTRRQRSSKTQGKSTVDEEKKTDGDCAEDEVMHEGAKSVPAEEVSATTTFPPGSKSEKEALQRKADRRRVRCSREGCIVERESGVRLMVCAGCKRARYCSKDCQKADFHSHKLVCKVK
ncbi:hypothetical protein KFL_002010070 [Klebsormidium nitens]|uniref:MYND-type domain-containing protein n=1 Tax=Klebsormidium nitens TaxID=105231 RepID=A0A0U9HV88_KLENI|nr:hypothetical protein KFL_002010070 [Klebsormidium nitens]|eukprot:GAQ84691.1 hypothetical protein KFL_002010070 [Klebsormidium nitens]